MEYTYEAVAVLSMFSRSCGGLACSESQEIDRYSLLNGFNSSINNLVLILVAIVIGWMEIEEAIAFEWENFTNEQQSYLFMTGSLCVHCVNFIFVTCAATVSVAAVLTFGVVVKP